MATADESGGKHKPAGDASTRAERLLERGLELYGAGDLIGALADWEAAVATDPGLERAHEYLDYVRANFDALSAQFSAAREAQSAAEADGVPVPEPRATSDSDDYASLDVELPDAAEAGELIDGLAELDAGLEQALELPPVATGRARTQRGHGIEPADDAGEALEMEAMAPDEDLPGMAPDLETGEHPPMRDFAGPIDGDAATDGDDDATIDVRVLPAMRRNPHLSPLDLDLDDLPPRGARPGIMTIQPRPGADTLNVKPVSPAGAGFEDEGHAAASQSGELELDDLVEASSTVRTTPPPSVAPPPAATPGRRAGSKGGHDEDEATRAFDRRPTGQRPSLPSRDPTPAPASRLVPPHKPAAGFLDELPTGERRPRRGGTARDDYAEPELTAEFEDSRQTREHNPFRDGPATGAGRPAAPAPGAPARTGDSSVIIDERLLQGAGLSPRSTLRDPDLTSDFRPRRISDTLRPAVAPPATTGGRTSSTHRPSSTPPAATSPRPTATPVPVTRPPAGAPTSSDPRQREPREVREDRVRRQVGELLKQAEEAAQNGDFLSAVTAVEAATKNDEEGSVAPVLLHRHRDLLYRIYEGHIGDMHAVPLVAVPLHEIAGQTLDHRTGFLLSRIDGMLSFEDILDVAGMPRMEAYQILSSLLRKGVIEVR